MEAVGVLEIIPMLVTQWVVMVEAE